jgi:fatty acid desaturase
VFRQGWREWPHVLAIAYTVFGWATGIWMLTRTSLALNAVGVLLTAHALVYSAYLVHECVHHCIFKAATANDRLGILMGWINGACAADYARLKKKHLRHHSDRLDVVTFDYRATLAAAPAWARHCVLALEWAYIPAVEFMMRGMVLAAPFKFGTGRDQVRVIATMTVRIVAFIGLALLSVKALLLYALAYLLFLTVLRFMDAFQHTYDVFPSRSLAPAPADPRRTRRYEYENTYSNLLAVRWPWLNLLVLNFPYHNAHHARSGTPWYRLYALHRALYGEGDPQVLGFGTLAANYHRHRVARVLAEDYGSVNVSDTGAKADSASGFIGAVGVSFLTAV